MQSMSYLCKDRFHFASYVNWCLMSKSSITKILFGMSLFDAVTSCVLCEDRESNLKMRMLKRHSQKMKF
jgi:hypothetical protein